MAGEPSGRKLLPQSNQMQNFSFAPNNTGPRENQKNYVFVDEHNRHKRLKVMRACEGCRRRKIKCDAATTNTWPCSACIRLKLQCVPPTINYDRDLPAGTEALEQGRGELVGRDGGAEEYHQVSMQQQLAGPQKIAPPIYTQQGAYPDGVGVYQPVYAEPSSSQSQQIIHYDNLQTPVSVLDQHQHYPPSAAFQPHQLPQSSHPESPVMYDHDQYGQQNLSDLLGELEMNEAGTAPYLNKNKIRNLVEEPAAFEDVEEYKHVFAPSLPGPDLKVRIPPELMPDEETASHYFNMYFSNVHPYVPVLDKTLFYHQWHNSRESISPLILEAIFAIGGRLTDEPAQGHQWLALASKHADFFMDIPRLSTLQAMLIVLKARESAPKRGYYYRSWMTIVQCVQMGKDLGLDEHYVEHKAGRACGSDLAECITKTRIWQTISICELMIGSPQGRTDLSVDVDSVDLSVQRLIPGFEDAEFHVTRNYTYFARVVRNVRRMNMVYAQIKKKKDWGLDPDFVQLNPSFDAWMNDLPPDLQITFPPDGSTPWLPSHFIGNLHSYYYLSIIMLHRPQLTFSEPSGQDGVWKHHMMICYSSAKLLCRLQEAIIQSFGATGLLSMQRGINFTIYCVLTCTVLHLVALTSPDPEFNGDAREYFTRHMRILEKCSSLWPMPDMQQQIDALREAFSADIRKPFVLKPTFPYGSPGAPARPSPPITNTPYSQVSSHGHIEHQNTPQPPHVSYTHHPHPISPPISAGDVDLKSDSPGVQSLVMIPPGQRGPQLPMSSGVPMVDTSGWNPSIIFDRWNTTFGTGPPPPSTSTAQGTPLKHSLPGAQEIHQLPEMQTVANMTTPGAHPLPPQQYSGAAIPSFVSPSMWQESVASVYEGGLKRNWDFAEGGGGHPSSKRR